MLACSGEMSKLGIHLKVLQGSKLSLSFKFIANIYSSFTLSLVMKLFRKMPKLFRLGSRSFACFHGCSMLCLPSSMFQICQAGFWNGGGKWVVDRLTGQNTNRLFTPEQKYERRTVLYHSCWRSQYFNFNFQFPSYLMRLHGHFMI